MITLITLQHCFYWATSSSLSTTSSRFFVFHFAYKSWALVVLLQVEVGTLGNNLDMGSNIAVAFDRELVLLGYEDKLFDL